ncbi:3-hydroxyanthranilate 3,4-dioxygenase [Adhaeribacter sp. BT258]|uniref:3-hydroxyanthranilate 3,4-dioxygenase n=1 Tax=Adhaeribacter terrigena TaxID=2793070 RepID=A0ABS1C488_9BACT|nr:3-hydroxyanthranilate 3,4-dioxygenase [Adhaeribacter terrigena]MBK0404214.1 3-hydroxyanthranilate 3,4-dioxygenase [Adhaeribacter terrigena]
MAVAAPFNFKKWIDENRHLLKPPVGNQQVYKDNKDFIVMVVGGPNSRKDYHYNEGEEFFYQLEGDIQVKIIENDKPRTIDIKEGDIFLLPGGVPHSPQRPANTVGLVIERYRQDGEKDGFIWLCENCDNKLYEEYFEMTDIVKQLPEVMKNFYGDVEKRTCKKCGTVMEPPQPPKADA